MTRIIAGAAGGRRLQTPRGDATRPTSDRVREALFSAVDAWAGSLRGLRVLDLYAGSGAVGLEAWSRGAAAVTLVESDRRTADLIRANARAVGCPVADVAARSVSTFLAPSAQAPHASHAPHAPQELHAPYDLVFADPPYPLADVDVATVLAALVDGGWLAADALVVVERSSRSPEPTWPAGLVPLAGRRGAKKYGETTLWFAEHPAEDAAGGAADGAAEDVAEDVAAP